MMFILDIMVPFTVENMIKQGRAWLSCDLQVTTMVTIKRDRGEAMSMFPCSTLSSKQCQARGLTVEIHKPMSGGQQRKDPT